MARATEARDAVASCQSFVDAAEAAARARGDRERSEVLQKVAVYADEARVDVGELRRRQAASESALGALEEKLHLVKDSASLAVEDAPAVRRAAAAGARIDAAEEQLLKLETRLGNVLEVKIAEQASDGDGRDRRLARLEAWRDEHGGGGAEGAIKKLGDADETARKRDVADAAARADALAKNVDEQALAHRAAVNAASKAADGATKKLAGRVDDFSEAVNGARNLRIRVDALEADHGELRATVSRHHGDLSTSSQLAFERSAKDARVFQRDVTNDLEAVRAVAKGALGRTERVLVELDAVARRVDDLAADVKTSATLAARRRAPAPPGAAPRRAARDDADADESKPVVRVVLARERAGGVATSPTASGGATSPSLSKSPSPSRTPSRRSDSDEDLDDVEDVPLDAAPAPAPEKPRDPVVVRMRSPSPKALPSPASPRPVDESSDDGDGGGEPTTTLSFGGGGDSSGDETPPEAAPAAEPVDFRSRFARSSGLDAQKSVVGTEKESDDDDFDDDYGTSDSDA
ncbi:hypothetical protein JL720_15848 [Aureococcus anophagefferens]|nr:hypothetical protein JL720_15848 [Aureococcus anophagefferens]